MAKKKSDTPQGSYLVPVNEIPGRARGEGGKWTQIAEEAAARPKGTFGIDLDGANAKSANSCLRRIIKVRALPLTVTTRTVDGELNLYLTVNKK